MMFWLGFSRKTINLQAYGRRYLQRCAQSNLELKYQLFNPKTERGTGEEPRIIYSGIQPTGSIHLGNYLGAIRNWVHLQKECEKTIYCIVDMHAITLPYNHREFQKSIFAIAATLIACGIDPEKSILYQQSQVLEHASLNWILTCLTTLPRLNRIPQYKEKAANFTNKSVPTGLFVYPVLQAADILLFKTTHVPVGEDQLQHIELAKQLSENFNCTYGDTFPIPKTILFDDASARIKNLKDPNLKMSKSAENPKSRIDILDSPDVIASKIKKSLTDFTSAVYFDSENRPGVSNLMTIHSALSGKSYSEIASENSNIDTGKYKNIVADVIIEHLTPIRERTLELIKDRDYLEKIIKNGNKKAQKIAQNTLSEVHKKVGFQL